LAPLEKKEPSDATQDAADRFGALMQGVPLPLRTKHLIDQIEVLMPLLAGKVTLITQRDNMATQEEGVGLANTSQYIEQAIQQLSQDQQQKARVKQYTDGMGRLTNEIKGLIQRGEEKRQADAQKEADGENQAELMAMQAKLQIDAQAAQQKLQMNEMTSAQSMTQKQISAEADERRKSEAARAEIDRKNEATLAEIERKNAELRASIDQDRAKTAADIENSRKLATAKAKEPKAEPAAAK
jgi:hypothetical protein